MAAVTFPPLISITPFPLWNSWQTLPAHDDAAGIRLLIDDALKLGSSA